MNPKEITPKTAEEIVKILAEWSNKYPRGVVYSMNSPQDKELIAIEEMAKSFVPSPPAELKEIDYKDRYEKIANSDWFQKAYNNMSSGEEMLLSDGIYTKEQLRKPFEDVAKKIYAQGLEAGLQSRSEKQAQPSDEIKKQISDEINRAVTRHLVQHIQTPGDTRDRLVIMLEEATENILKIYRDKTINGRWFDIEQQAQKWATYFTETNGFSPMWNHAIEWMRDNFNPSTPTNDEISKITNDHDRELFIKGYNYATSLFKNSTVSNPSTEAKTTTKEVIEAIPGQPINGTNAKITYMKEVEFNSTEAKIDWEKIEKEHKEWFENFPRLRNPSGNEHLEWFKSRPEFNASESNNENYLNRIKAEYFEKGLLAGARSNNGAIEIKAVETDDIKAENKRLRKKLEYCYNKAYILFHSQDVSLCSTDITKLWDAVEEFKPIK